MTNKYGRILWEIVSIDSPFICPLETNKVRISMNKQNEKGAHTKNSNDSKKNTHLHTRVYIIIMIF